jgi:hypothetical protein
MGSEFMMSFLLYTVLAILANACIVKILHISIQPGQWLDTLLHWQQRLQQWDMEGRIFLAKAGGYCELCFSHLLSFLGYWAYVFFMNVVMNQWIVYTADGWIVFILANLIWYLVYISIATNLGLYFITKLFEL